MEKITSVLLPNDTPRAARCALAASRPVFGSAIHRDQISFPPGNQVPRLTLSRQRHWGGQYGFRQRCFTLAARHSASDHPAARRVLASLGSISFMKAREFSRAFCFGQITSDFPKSRQASAVKIFRFRSHANQRHNPIRLTARWGASAIVTNARSGCDGRTRRDRRKRPKRTAKSCGSDVAVLASSSQEAKAFCGRRRQKSRSPGRARSKP